MTYIEVETISYTESRFWLEAATDPDEFTTADLLFSNEDLARKAALELAKSFSWVQISEWGEWHLKNGQAKTGWVAFWWTKSCGYRGEPAKKSGEIGVPEGKKTAMSYNYLNRPKGK